jgi:O-methyltransferase
MSLRKTIVKFLQFTRLNRLAHRYYYRHVHGFKAATKELIAAIEKVYQQAESLGTLGQGDYLEFGIF